MGHRSEKGRHLRYRTGMLENIPVPGQIQVSDAVDVIVTNSVSDPGFFRIRISLFSESGSGSAKNPDPIRKNPDPDP